MVVRGRPSRLDQRPVRRRCGATHAAVQLHGGRQSLDKRTLAAPGATDTADHLHEPRQSQNKRTIAALGAAATGNQPLEAQRSRDKRTVAAPGAADTCIKLHDDRWLVAPTARSPGLIRLCSLWRPIGEITYESAAAHASRTSSGSGLSGPYGRRDSGVGSTGSHARPSAAFECYATTSPTDRVARPCRCRSPSSTRTPWPPLEEKPATGRTRRDAGAAR